MVLLRTLYQTLRPYVEPFVNFIYPPYCLLCDSYLSADSHLICEVCWTRLPRAEKAIDPIVPLSGILAVWHYTPEVQTVIHEMKFRKKKSLTARMGEEMARALQDQGTFATADVLIPVPLHKLRLRERGYNQSLLLARRISEFTHVPLDENCLKRIRYTRPQSKLNASERTANVEGAFRVSQAGEVGDKVVVLIDDVFTTGSTLRACAAELMGAGARKVLALTAAVAEA